MLDSATFEPTDGKRRLLVATPHKAAADLAPVVNNLKVSLVLILVQAIWSLNAVYAKTGLREMHVMVWYSLRLILATPGFFVLAYFRERESLLSSRATKDWLWLLLLGMIGMVLNQLLFLSGLSLTTATNAGMVAPAISVFSTAISVLLCLEKLSVLKVVGISTTVIGALIILEVENFELFGSNDILLGNLLTISSTVCFSFFIVLQKPLTARITPTVLNFFVFAVGLVVIVPITLIGFWDEVVDVAYNASLNAYMSTVYSAFVAGVVGYSLNTWAIHQIAASNVALYYCLQALMVALFAWLLLGESLSVRVGIGGILIMAGLLLVTWGLDRQRKKEAAKRKAVEVAEDDEDISLLKKDEMTPKEAAVDKIVDNDRQARSGGDKEATAQWQDVEAGSGDSGSRMVTDVATPTAPPGGGEAKKSAGETDNYGTFV